MRTPSLTDDQVNAIRAELRDRDEVQALFAQFSYQAIGARHGVSHSMVWRIHRGYSYGMVIDPKDFEDG